MTHQEPHQLARRTIGLVLAGGRGSRLHALTDRRAKPAVYFGGKFRIVDFALSNCLNSGVRRIGVVTQYKSHSLLRHLQRGWSFLRSEFNEFIDLLPAQQRIDETSWYQGTADAVFQNLDILMAEQPEYILILAGDHVYKMDYANLIADHVAQGAPCTVACIEVPLAEASAFGVMAVNAQRRIVRFDEKPARPAPMPGRESHALASMGVYVFDAAYLMVENGRASRKDGAGFYNYEDGKRGLLWQGVRDHFKSGSNTIPLEDLKERMLFAEALETVKCFDEGVLNSVADANIGSIFGIGFPAWTGGVIQYINGYEGGLQGFVDRARDLASKYGAHFEPPASLVEKAAKGEKY